MVVSDKSTKFQTNTPIAMLADDKNTEIFVMADEFCKGLNAMLRRRSLCKKNKYFIPP